MKQPQITKEHPKIASKTHRKSLCDVSGKQNIHVSLQAPLNRNMMVNET